MKKLLCLLLAVAMTATMLAGCGSQSTTGGTTGENSTPQAEKRKRS